MKKSIKRLKSIDEEKDCLNVIVETPKGSGAKYSYDLDSGFFLLSKSMPTGMIFPFNFGFVPQTLAQDGDPLDVLIINEEPLISGCLLKVRPVAVMKAAQTENGKAVRNDRIIGEALPKSTPLEFEPIKLDKKLVSDIERFFVTYNKLYGKKFKVLGNEGPGQAWKIVRQAIKLCRTEMQDKTADK